MYNKVNNISEERTSQNTYKEKLDALFTSLAETKKPISTLSCCALPYISFMWTKFHGIDPRNLKN
jgi:hypothetical protein